MKKLIYIANTSLDGYIEDERGAIDWANPEQVHEFITDLVRPIATHLYGRRLYETMAYWGANALDAYPPEHRAFAQIWQQTRKIVFSRTLAKAEAEDTRVERAFDPQAIRRLKAGASGDLLIGGAELASAAIAAGLVDECHLFVHPVILGGGKPAFASGLRPHLRLLDTHGFSTGAVHLHYRIAASG